MKTSLVPEQIAQYRADGFIHVPGFLSAEETVTLKGAVVETARSMGKRKVAGQGIDLQDEGDDFYSKVFTQRMNLWKINETIKGFMLSPELGRMLCQLEGIEGVRVWHDQALIKEPFANGTAWHLDNPYWSFSSRQSLSIWIALEDATPFNGCMCFIPGSQKLASYDNVGIGQNMGDLFKLYPAMAKIDPVPVPMKAGDCSFHNGLVAHGAGANMTRGRRIAMTCAYMPEGSTFNGQQNILPKDYFQSLKAGDVLENEEQNPLLYSSRTFATV
jgi:phytanoyl-CoA hydroxylase